MNAQDGGDESEDTVNQQSDHSPAVMTSRRRNLLSRKFRPKSTVSMGQDASADYIADLVPPLNEQLGSGHQGDDPDDNEEEPGVNVDESQADVSRKSAPLKHLGLSRPKQSKKRLPHSASATLKRRRKKVLTSMGISANGRTRSFTGLQWQPRQVSENSVSLGSSRMRGSLGSVSSADLGSPSLESVFAESRPTHRLMAGYKPSDEAAGSSSIFSMEELTLDENTVKI
ncbi:hypothetical protein DAPPUDRAFT_247995 [Daphnia pulex]|uniref:CARMIL C-terminal domain-containing protein n=1 Tax=Daphnia pulex TaxID=6669 RepID=E9GTH2_DAPPU|nr:hypothetical protein DAPPUDRAFT_247998 [Daphnia pulex]EFX77215.1 hypothetical protein DAPPUDRAFT_247995 [Daphnia pulex]|eukprot:EFX77083.1 hypothetical protein DAPPUDRAFT_247998 [Daphnia pulex]